MDFFVVQGIPSAESIEAGLVAELVKLQHSQKYGCTGVNCTNFTSLLTQGPVLQYIDPWKIDLRNAASTDTLYVPPPDDPTGLIIACVVFGTVLLVVFVLCCRRYRKRQQFNKSPLLGYETTEAGGNYVAASLN